MRGRERGQGAVSFREGAVSALFREMPGKGAPCGGVAVEIRTFFLMYFFSSDIVWFDYPPRE
jgi:hypothetical protein